MSKERYWAITAIIAVAVACGWVFFGKPQSEAFEDQSREHEVFRGEPTIVIGGSGDSSKLLGSGSELKLATSFSRSATSEGNLRFERTLLRGGKISYDQTTRMLQGDKFDDYMQDVLQQSERDLEAARMTELYAQAIERAFNNSSSIFVEKFACGLSICIGAITTYGTQGEDRYSRFHQALSPADGTPAYSMIELPIGEEGAVMEHRFVFAADPVMNGIGDHATH